jgi:acyl-CoA thioesterase-1
MPAGALRQVAVVALTLVCAGCGDNDRGQTAGQSGRQAPSQTGSQTRYQTVQKSPGGTPAGRPRIVILGDSLTAGLGLPIEQAYPTLLQQRLNDANMPYEVVNAGVSGDTSAGGLARLDWSLQGDVRILVVALGGNDALRGLPIAELRANLSQIIERAQARHIAVMLAGMEAPPNWGRDYIVSFHKVYPELAAQYHVGLVPFLLLNVAGRETLNQNDGIHPTAAGARIVADNVWTVLKPLAAQALETRGGS